MIEFLKHSLGLCGESHLNVFTFFIGEFTYMIDYIKVYTQPITNYFKK